MNKFILKAQVNCFQSLSLPSLRNNSKSKTNSSIDVERLNFCETLRDFSSEAKWDFFFVLGNHFLEQTSFVLCLFSALSLPAEQFSVYDYHRNKFIHSWMKLHYCFLKLEEPEARRTSPIESVGDVDMILVFRRSELFSHEKAVADDYHLELNIQRTSLALWQWQHFSSPSSCRLKLSRTIFSLRFTTGLRVIPSGVEMIPLYFCRGNVSFHMTDNCFKRAFRLLSLAFTQLSAAVVASASSVHRADDIAISSHAGVEVATKWQQQWCSLPSFALCKLLLPQSRSFNLNILLHFPLIGVEALNGSSSFINYNRFQAAATSSKIIKRSWLS